MKKVSALIVTHNRLQKLQQTLAKCTAQDFHSIIIVNCGSTDNTSLWLENNKKDNWHCYPINNIGGAGGFAYGCQKALESLSFEWLLLFDDDAYPSQGLLEKFQKNQHTHHDLIGCKVTSPSGQLIRMNRLVRWQPSSLFSSLRYMANNKRFLADPNKTSDVESGSFVGLFVRRSCLEKTVHYIDRSLFVYFDDVIFTRYCTLEGYRYLYEPNLVFVHDTTEDISPPAWKLYLLARNQFKLKPLFKKSSLFYLLAIGRTLKLLYRSFTQPNRKLKIMSIFNGVYDGLTNNFSLTTHDKPIDQINKRIGVDV